MSECLLDARQHLELAKFTGSRCRPARLRTKVKWFILERLGRL